MPVKLPSFLIPSGPSVPFLLEDIYLRGGFRVLDDVEKRDQLPTSVKKRGMLVYTITEDKYWRLAPDNTTWIEFKTGGGGISELSGVDPIQFNIDGTISIRENATVPLTGEIGQVLTKTELGRAWQTITKSENVGVRQDLSYTSSLQLNPGDNQDFILDMGRTILLLILRTDTPDVQFQCFSTAERNDSNPYTFISTEDILQDDGSLIMPDSSVFYGRRYALLANLEEDSTNHYWSMTNVGNVPSTPSIYTTHLVLE